MQKGHDGVFWGVLLLVMGSEKASGIGKWHSVSQLSNEGVKPGRREGRKERERKKERTRK
jgi:hypothetical protein